MAEDISGESGSFQKISVYTDGSYNEKTNRYGASAVFVSEGIVVSTLSDSGEDILGMKNITGEICASEMAVRHAIECGTKELEVFYDYGGIGKWGTGEWNVERKELGAYAEFIREAMKHIRIRFTHVQGHTGNKYNELADTIAGIKSGTCAWVKKKDVRLSTAERKNAAGMQRPTLMASAIGRLPLEWSGCSSQAERKQIINTCRMVVAGLPYTPKIYPTGKGSVVIEYENDGSRLYIEIAETSTRIRAEFKGNQEMEREFRSLPVHDIRMLVKEFHSACAQDFQNPGTAT